MSVLQRTLGHITLPEDTYRPRGDSGAGASASDDDDAGGEGVGAAHAGPTARSSGVAHGARRSVERDARVASRRGVPPPLQPPGGAAAKNRFSTHGSWLFAPCIPSADAVAERCLEVLYQVRGDCVVVVVVGCACARVYV